MCNYSEAEALLTHRIFPFWWELLKCGHNKLPTLPGSIRASRQSPAEPSGDSAVNCPELKRLEGNDAKLKL